MKTQHQELIKKVTGMDSIPFVMSGIAADADGHVISEDGMIAIAEKLEAAENVSADLKNANDAKNKAEADLKIANAAKEKAEADLKTVSDAKATVDKELAELKQKDGGRFSAAAGSDDKGQEGEETDMSQYATSVDNEVK